MTRTTQPREPDLTPRQRWIAAQRLAAGDALPPAAAMAGVRPESVALLLKADPQFKDLVRACADVHALPPERWHARLIPLAREAAERAVIDGRSGTVNLWLRAGSLVAGPAVDPVRQGEEELAALLARLTPEERAEYEALGDEEDGDWDDEDEADGEEEVGRVLPFTRRGPLPAMDAEPEEESGQF
jgi:hypothetical protein